MFTSRTAMANSTRIHIRFYGRQDRPLDDAPDAGETA